jgi:hypothetical protein
MLSSFGLVVKKLDAAAGLCEHSKCSSHWPKTNCFLTSWRNVCWSEFVQSYCDISRDVGLLPANRDNRETLLNVVKYEGDRSVRLTSIYGRNREYLNQVSPTVISERSAVTHPVYFLWIRNHVHPSEMVQSLWRLPPFPFVTTLKFPGNTSCTSLPIYYP